MKPVLHRSSLYVPCELPIKGFYAAVEMDEKYEKELKNCLAVLKHMGIARTRGFGEIKATLEVQAEKNNPVKCAAYQQNADYLEYEIRLLSPVICKSGTYFTPDYRSGTERKIFNSTF